MCGLHNKYRVEIQIGLNFKELKPQILHSMVEKITYKFMVLFIFNIAFLICYKKKK